MKNPQYPLVDKSNSKKHIHTTISATTFDMIEKLTEQYGSKQSVIEEAIKHLQVKNHRLENIRKKDLDAYQIWHLMRDDFNMMAVGRRTFLSYIAEIPEEPIRNNNAVEIIEWYHNNINIQQINLFQILEAIKYLWEAGNYFRTITIKILDNVEPYQANVFKMIFSHDFDDIRYGKYWAKYFKYVLEQDFIQAHVKYNIRNQSFYLDIDKS